MRNGGIMGHRLYIVEGLPCTGKSTAAEYIAQLLRGQGKTVHCFDEGCGDHPADYEFHSFITEADFAEFTQAQQEKLSEISEKRCGGYVVPLSQCGELFDALIRYKIYDMLAWETERPIMLDKWRRFIEEADSDAVYVFNCCFLQNPMCETMMRFGFTKEQSAEYIAEIAHIIAPFKPVVIYLQNSDIAECVRKTATEREGWLDAVIDYHNSGAYGRSINAHGFEGYIACLEERQRRELEILSQISVESHVISEPQRDRKAASAEIKRVIA